MSINMEGEAKMKVENGVIGDSHKSSTPTLLSCVTRLIGTEVIVELVENVKYKGILKACTDNFDVVLSYAQKLPVSKDEDYCLSPQNANRFIQFDSKQIICITGDFYGNKERGFATDAEIGVNGIKLDYEKDFEEWEAGEEGDGSLDSQPNEDGFASNKSGRPSKNGGGWSVEDMLKKNEELGVESSFSKDLSQYTTVEAEGTNEDRELADRIAREIEGKVESKRHEMLENDDEERDLDVKTDFPEDPTPTADIQKNSEDEFEAVQSRKPNNKYTQRNNSNPSTPGSNSNINPNRGYYNRRSADENTFNRSPRYNNQGGGRASFPEKNFVGGAGGPRYSSQQSGYSSATGSMSGSGSSERIQGPDFAVQRQGQFGDKKPQYTNQYNNRNNPGGFNTMQNRGGSGITQPYFAPRKDIQQKMNYHRATSHSEPPTTGLPLLPSVLDQRQKQDGGPTHIAHVSSTGAITSLTSGMVTSNYAEKSGEETTNRTTEVPATTSEIDSSTKDQEGSKESSTDPKDPNGSLAKSESSESADQKTENKESDGSTEPSFQFNPNAIPFVPKPSTNSTPAPPTNIGPEPITVLAQPLLSTYPTLPLQMAGGPGIVSGQIPHGLPPPNFAYNATLVNYSHNSAALIQNNVPSVYAYPNPQVMAVSSQMAQQQSQQQHFSMQPINATAVQGQQQVPHSRTDTPNGGGGMTTPAPPAPLIPVDQQGNPMLPPNNLQPTLIPMNNPPQNMAMAHVGIPMIAGGGGAQNHQQQQHQMVVSVAGPAMIQSGPSHPPLYQQYPQQLLPRSTSVMHPQYPQQQYPQAVHYSTAQAGGVYVAAPQLYQQPYQQPLIHSQYQVPYYYQQAAAIQTGPNVAGHPMPPPNAMQPAQHIVPGTPTGLINRPGFYPQNVASLAPMPNGMIQSSNGGQMQLQTSANSQDQQQMQTFNQPQQHQNYNMG